MAPRKSLSPSLAYLKPEAIREMLIRDGFRLIIYRSDRDFGTYPGAKVMGDTRAHRAVLLRFAAALEDFGIPVSIEEDRYGNPTLWVENDYDIETKLGQMIEIAKSEEWKVG